MENTVLAWVGAVSGVMSFLGIIGIIWSFGVKFGAPMSMMDNMMSRVRTLWTVYILDTLMEEDSNPRRRLRP